MSSLHAAISEARATSLVATLLQNGADPNEAVDGDASSSSSRRRTALHVAAETGQVEMCSLLLVAKADVTAVDAADRTPLHVAAAGGHADVAKLLIAHGSDPWARSSFAGYPDSCCCCR